MAHFWLGAALAFAGRQEEGIPQLKIALELAPRDPRKKFFNTLLALAYLTTGQVDRALEWARAAAHPRSDFIEAPLALASILAHLGKEKEARAALDRIAVANLGAVERRLDEASSFTHTALARALCWSDQHDSAIEEANRALELNQYDAMAHFWLGAALAFAGRQEEGIPQLKIALELAPRDPRKKFFNTLLALAYLTTGQVDRALEWARAAAHPRSDFIEAPLALASILAHLGKEKEARAALDRIAVASLGAVERRPFWRRYRYPKTKELVLDGLRKAGLSE